MGRILSLLHHDEGELVVRVQDADAGTIQVDTPEQQQAGNQQVGTKQDLHLITTV